MSAVETETSAEKIARLRREKMEREAAFATDREAFELRELELDARFSAELGRRGTDWVMVSDDRFNAVVVLKRGADLAFRAFCDAATTADGAPAAADLFAFAAPCVVYPSQEEFAELVRARGFISNRCADAVLSLHALRQKKMEGKF